MLKARSSVTVVVIFVLLLYAIAWGVGINRIVGGNVEAGRGLGLGANDPDTLHVIPGWGNRIGGANNDSVIVDVAAVDDSFVTLFSTQNNISGAKTFTTNVVSMSAGLTVSAGTVSLPANEIGDAEVAGIDSAWVTDGGLIAADIKSGNIIKLGKVSGQVALYDSLIFAAGTNVTLDQTGNTITINSSGGATAAGWHLGGQANSIDTLIFKDGNGIKLVQSLGNGDTLSIDVLKAYGLLFDTDTLKVDTTTLNSLWINDGAGEINAAADFNFVTPIAVTNLVADSATMVISSAYLGADAVSDSTKIANGGIGWSDLNSSWRDLLVTDGILEDTMDVYWDTATSNTKFINDGGGEINATGDFNFSSAVHITNLVADSATVVLSAAGLGADCVDSTKVGSNALSMDDMQWRPDLISSVNFSIAYGVEDSVNVLFPVGVPGHPSFAMVWNNTATSNLLCTLLYSFVLPKNAQNLDSINVPLKTYDATAYCKLLLYSYVWNSTETSIYAGSDTSTSGSYTWVNVPGSSITDIPGGTKLVLKVVNKISQNDTNRVDFPEFWFKW